MSFNGYNGCLKCITKGTYSFTANTMIYPDCKAPLRNDKDFRNNVYTGHKRSSTIIERLPIDMINDFPIADALHIIDLGITKRFLSGFKIGNLSNMHAKWSVQQSQEVSEFLIKCQMPSEIHRSVRGLDDLAHWKGTEFRTFLLYISLVVFKKFVAKEQIFRHFLLYFCAIHICSRSDQVEGNYRAAQQMLLDYLKEFKKLYGLNYFTINLHNLCHIVDDVIKFGPLHTLDAYPFESRLYYLKRLLRTGANPLSQAARRISEIQAANCFKQHVKPKKDFVLKSPIKEYDADLESTILFLRSTNAEMFTRIEFPSFILNTLQQKDKWILSKNSEIISLQIIIRNTNNEVYFYGYPLIDLRDYFATPVESSKLNIFESNCIKGTPKYYKLTSIHSKLVRIQYNDHTFVFIPLVHTIGSVK